MHKKTLSALILLAVAALACTCNLPSLPGQDATSEPPPQANVIFQDDFSDTASGWEMGDYDAGSVGYTEGVYFVRSEAESSTMWGVANRSFDNVVIDVDITQVSAGPDDNNDYGVVCREQGDGNGYYLLISGDGYYAILKAENQEYTELMDWTTSNAINTGNTNNHIRAICNGSSLTLSVNGEELASIEDNTFSSGDIGLTATTYESEPTEIHFDNLVVSEP